MSNASKTVVLVHGAWHGAWCWAALQAELDRRGVASYAIDLPGHGASTLGFSDMHGDAQHVADVLESLRPRSSGDIVLVGHSYGGAVITEAAARVAAAGTADVAELVYIAAFVLDSGESVTGLLTSMPKADSALNAAIEVRDNGMLVLADREAGITALYGGCPTGAITASVARWCPQPIATFAQPATGAPWQTTSSTYVLCRQDRAISPAHQALMATRCRSVVELDAGHSPFLSKIIETADIVQRVVEQ
ncbi:MAG: alpha/beta hydrolase [Ilumatobacteraceae bacterium]